MKETTILYIGNHPKIKEIVVRLLNENWTSIGVSTEEEAIKKMQQVKFDIVLFGCGIEPDEENRLRSYFLENDPDIKIIQHYGGGSGLLKSEILEALENRKIGI